mgnify:FL=1
MASSDEVPCTPGDAAGQPMSGETMAIGVCTHNRGEALGRTLAALAAMDRVGGRVARVIVVDNRSTAANRQMAQRLAREHDRGEGFMHFETEDRPGKVAAIERFLATTNDAIVGIVDDDVLVDPDWGARMLARADRQPRAGCIGGRIDLRWETGPTKIAQRYRQSLAWQDRGDEPHEIESGHEFVAGASVVYRREAIDATGWPAGALLDCRRGAVLAGGEDAELCLRIRRSGWEVWYEPAARCEHQIPAARQNTRYIATLRQSICATEPVLRWIAEGGLAPAEVDRGALRARRLLIKTLLTDLRPTRRRVRLAERRGRVLGWDAVRTLQQGG